MDLQILSSALSELELSRDDEALILLYAAETGGRSPIRHSEVERAYREARVPPPNVSRQLGRLRAQQLVLGSGAGWSLSRKGFMRAEGLLKEAGLMSTEPAQDTVTPLRRVSAKLRSDASRVGDSRARAFLEEALRCLDPAVAALRAAVVLAWAGGVEVLKGRVWAAGAGPISSTVTRLGWRYRVAKEDDLDDVREANLLILAHELGLFDKAVLKTLSAHLDFRNACAHPTDIVPGVHKVEAFLEDVIAILY